MAASGSGSGIAIGLLGAGLMYLLAKGKEKSAELDALKKQRQVTSPRRAAPSPQQTQVPSVPSVPATDIAPEPEPSYVWQPDGAVPPLQPGPAWPARHSYPYPAPHAYAPSRPPPPPQGFVPTYPPYPYPAPPPRPYPSSSMPHHGALAPPGAPWARATQDDVSRDRTTSWYLDLLNSAHPVGYSEQRVVNGRRWKLTIVSASTDPLLTLHGRDVIGWVLPPRARPAPPRMPAPHAFPTALSVPYPLVAPVHYPAPAAWPPMPQAGPGGLAAPPRGHLHAPHPAVDFAAPRAPMEGCTHWRPATDADVAKDGVASVYHAMLPLSASSEPRVENHNGRTWKFQVVTHDTDPSFVAQPGGKAVRGWICMDAPSADPGY